ncbi:MAG: hypothetical protein QN168_14290 [Armatimonadota bacterium]|nr:hypothetical protein [Armatimonadota bacterium]
MDFLKPFLRYWSLTLAVFVFYFFAVLVALLDILATVTEEARKKRAGQKAALLDPNPLAGRTVAETILPGPGQRLDAKREWVARTAADVLRRLKLTETVRTIVLEDSKGHPLVQFSDGKRLESYRVDRAVIEAAMAGDTARLTEISDLLTRHLTADFLGVEEARPPRTTELAREAAARAPAAGAQIKTAPVAAAAPAVQSPAAAVPSPPAPAATPAGPAMPAPAVDPESLSREERLALARAKAEALRAARQKDKPPE